MRPTLHLTDLLESLQPRWWHWTMKLMGLSHQSLSEWAHQFCPCGLTDDLEDLEELDVDDWDIFPIAA